MIVAVAIAIAAFLVAFLVVPVGAVVYTAFSNATGDFTFAHFATFFQISLMRESFWNSLYVAGMSVVFASLIAIPLAYFTVRFRFRGAIAIQTLGVLPLIMPPFVGAVAMQLLFGRSGSVNLLLQQHLGFTIPFMEGLNGVIFVESLHYFPFILLNLVVALQNIDASLEEAAQNLGASGFRLFRRVVFPLAMPGYIAGASLVFVKVFDDLGTPLVLGATNMLAPQAYLRITSVGIEDPIGYVISVIMIGFSVAALALSAAILKGRDYATLQRGRRLRVDLLRADPGALAAPGHPAALGLANLELQRAARGLHACALPDSAREFLGDDRQHAALLRARGVDRRDPRRGDRLHHPAHAPSRTPVARPHRLDGARDPRRRARDRVPAHLQGRGGPVHGHGADRNVVPAHDRLCDPQASVCAALVPRGAAAAPRLARGSGREPGRDQGAGGAARRVAAHGGRDPRRFRRELHHRRRRALGDHRALDLREPGADVLRHLPLHAEHRGSRAGCRARRARGRDRGDRHLCNAPPAPLAEDQWIKCASKCPASISRMERPPSCAT